MAFYATLTVAFTWPLVLDPLGTHVSVQFDMYGVLWLEHAAPTLHWSGGTLRTALANWPFGQSAARADSFVLLGMARLLARLDPRLAGALCTLVGPPLSAWAAERYARRHLGASWPWSLLAGLAFAFNGLAATALLEGHVYDLLDPWLPLLAGAWTRAIGPAGRTRDGLLAGAWWALAVATSAYVGLAATALVAVFLAVRLIRARPRWRPLAGAAAIALPAAAAYVALFVAAGPGQRVDRALDPVTASAAMAPGSAHLATLAAWNPAIDLVGHSIAPVLGWTALVLVLFAPVVLRGKPGWGAPLAAALACGALALGSSIELVGEDLGIPWLLRPLSAFPQLSFFHFPARLLWVTGLGLGAVAARVATDLAGRRGAALLLPFAVADALLGTGAPLRDASVPISAPSAYRAAPAGWAVLDLVPVFEGPDSDLESFVNNLTCSYQLRHDRPSLSLCLGTTIETGPRWTAGTWLQSKLLGGDLDGVADRLASVGVGAVVFHPDLFAPEDAARLESGLEDALGSPAAASRDGGEYVVVYDVPGTREAGPPARAARLAAWKAAWGAS